MNRGVFILGWLMILASLAYGIESYSVDYQIYEDGVYVSEEFIFDSYMNLSDFELSLPRDIKDVKVFVDNGSEQ